MNLLDYTVVLIYLVLLISLGLHFRKQNDKEDYFLGGKQLGWFPLSLSAMATQLGAISFVSAPAFVGLRENGGMIWLSYELGVPLAMFLILAVIAPKLYHSGVVSIYEFVEKRFGLSSRLLLSFVFQISRGFASGVTIYAVGIILQSVFAIPFWQSLVVVGVFTMLYSLVGGMRAVVIGDAIQMVLIVIGTLLCLVFAVYELGGIDVFLTNLDQNRLQSLDFSSLGFSGDEFGFWPMVFGGFVLYASYYGCDQTQAQRILAGRSIGDTRKMLIANGILRFPITLLYCTMGLAVGTLAVMTPEFIGKIPESQPDWMVPIFIIDYLPHGIIGIVIVALLSAAMSSLSSAINSLSAVTVEDISRLLDRKLTYKQYLLWARIAAFSWGAITLALSGVAGNIATTVIEAINKVGSLFYGPILAMFLLAMLSKSVKGGAANIGLLGGLLTNLYLWLFQPQVFWFWWNFFGFISAIAAAYIVTFIKYSYSKPDIQNVDLKSEASVVVNKDVGITRGAIGMLGMFILIVVIALTIQ